MIKKIEVSIRILFGGFVIVKKFRIADNRDIYHNDNNKINRYGIK